MTQGSIIGVIVVSCLVLMASSATATTVSVEPTTQIILSGQNFSVNVSVDAVTEMTTEGAILHFDPSAMQATEIIEGLTSGHTPFITVTDIDNTNGFVLFTYSITDNVSGSGPLATIKFTTNASKECTFALNLSDVELYNESGEITVDAINNGTVKLDQTPPMVTIIAPTEGEWFDSEDVWINFTACDNKADILYVEIYDGVTLKWWNDSVTNCIETKVNLGILDDCNHTITVRANDTVGKIGEALVNISVDRYPPVIEILSPSTCTWFDSENVTVIFRAWDNKADVINYSIYLDDSLVEQATMTNGSQKEKDLGVLTECDHTIRVNVTDKVEKTNSSEVTIHVDLTKPRVVLQSPVTRTYASACVRLIFVAEDLGTCPSGINWTAYNLDETGNVTIAGNTTIPIGTAGTHNVTVYVKDKVDKGNKSETITFTIHPADIDFDGKVWVSDVFQMRLAYNSHPGNGNWNIDADLDCNDHVWVGDVNILRNNYTNKY